MNPTDIVFKTEKGAAEVAARSRGLPPRLRTMLILVDGKLDARQLIEAGAKLGVPADFLDDLEGRGLIASRPSTPLAGATPASAMQAPTATHMPMSGPAAETASPSPKLSEAERFRVAQKFMNDTIVNALGFRALFFTLKLEKCLTIADLRELLGAYGETLAKRSGDEVARALVLRARELLR